MTQTTNDWRDRAKSLLQAAKDVVPPDHPTDVSTGSAQHKALFKKYVGELDKHKCGGEKWINSLIDSEEERTGDRNQAIINVMGRRPVGAVSFPYVTGTVRKFWLECVALNKQSAMSEQVAPEEFILKWLMQQGHDDLAEFLTGYPYWPMGLSGDGDWV